MVTLTTERFVLEPLTIRDAPFILQLLNTKEWKQYIGDRGLQTIEQAEEYIRNRYLNTDKHVFTIRRKEGDEVVGTCGLYRREELPFYDLGYAILPRFFRKGYAYEAGSRLIIYAKEQLALSTLLAITAQHNKPSKQLLEKLHFQPQGLVQLQMIKEKVCLYKRELSAG